MSKKRKRDMASATKVSIVKSFSSQFPGIPENQLKKIVDAFLQGILAELGRGRRVKLRQFGIFSLRLKGVYRMPNRDGTYRWIVATPKIRFKQSTAVRRTTERYLPDYLKDRYSVLTERAEKMNAMEKGKQGNV